MLIYIYHDCTKDLSWFTTKLYLSNGKKKKRERMKKKEEGLKEGEKTEDGELCPREK